MVVSVLANQYQKIFMKLPNMLKFQRKMYRIQHTFSDHILFIRGGNMSYRCAYNDNRI